MLGKLFTLSVAATVLAVGLPRPARAADDAPRWKATGPYYAVVTQTNDLTMTILDEKKTKRDEETYVYQVTQAERKGGGWDVELVLKRVTGDSDEVDAWKRCVGLPVTLEFDANMAFQKMSGVDKLAEKFAEGQDAEEFDAKSAADLITQGLLEQVGDAFVALPTAKPTTVKRAGSVAGFLTIASEREYAVPKTERGGLLAYRFTGEDKVAVADDQSALPFKVEKLDTKEACKPTGTVWFDPALGRPTRVQKSQSFEVALTVSAGGNEGEVSMAAKSEQDVRFVAKMPPDDK